MNILVTGIAGDIGFGIGKILKETKGVKKLVGCDTHSDHFGNQVFDFCEKIPKVTEPGYEKAFRRLVAQKKIQGVFVASEPELRYFAKKNLTKISKKITFFMPNKKTIKIGFDKFKTSQFISKINIPCPWTRKVATENPLEFPCILKSRYGSGNKSVHLVKTAKEARAYKKLFRTYIWQEFLGDKTKEFTCGVYGSNEGEIRVIVFRRRLNSGSTCFAELVKIPIIEKICSKIAKKLSLKGSINIQLKLQKGKPMIFEINPRFSSTVLLRHQMGFRDVVWSLQENLLKLKTEYKLKRKNGARAIRKFQEWKII